MISHRTRIWSGRISLAAGAALALPQLAFGQEEGPSKASCAQAYESAQESRASGQLQETRQRLALCARTECPSFVQKDCARWLVEVERELPSVVVAAPGIDGPTAAQVSVKVDGQIVVRGLSGEPLPLDPGPHELIVERPGREPVRLTIMAQQGVQKRVVEIQFEEPAPPPSTELDLAPDSSALRPYAFASWGLGAVGFGVFAVFGTLGRADEQSLREDCRERAPSPEVTGPGICQSEIIEERKSDYEREFIFADVGLIAGIAGAAAGTVLFVMSATDSAPPKNAELEAAGFRFDVSPTRGGAWATIQTEF